MIGRGKSRSIDQRMDSAGGGRHLAYERKGNEVTCQPRGGEGERPSREHGENMGRSAVNALLRVLSVFSSDARNGAV
jgi:hypothetical protein